MAGWTDRGWRGVAAGLVCACGLGMMSWGSEARGEENVGTKFRVYIGTYNSPKSKGIYRAEFDAATGTLSEPVLAVEAVDPSFLAIHPNKKFVYAVNESGEGSVSAYAIDPKSGDLKYLNQQPSAGKAPCHVIVDKKGTHALVANYTGGNAAVLAIDEEGKLGAMTGFTQHMPITGTKGQKKVPLGHSINLDAAGRFAFVCDAGIDGVFIYRYDGERGTLVPNDPATGTVPADAAPRHFAFHPDGKHAYAINEAALSISVFEYNPHTGSLTPTQVISTVPEGVDRTGYSTAEVVVHPSGKFVYGSNRGHDTIAAYTVNPDNGQLTLVGQQAAGTMKVPRNFNIDPTGTYALVEGQETDNIVVFKINPETGAFEATGKSVSVGKPVCIKFLAIEQVILQ